MEDNYSGRNLMLILSLNKTYTDNKDNYRFRKLNPISKLNLII